MIHHTSDFEKLPESHKRSLTFLRGIRDNVADRLHSEVAGICGVEKATELIEGMCGGYYARSSYSWLKSILRFSSSLALLDAFKAITDQIHKLECEAVGRAT